MRNIFGLDAAQVAELLARVESGTVPVGGAAQDDGPAGRADCFARAAWSTIAEPGDGTAGELVNRLGAAAALTAVIERWNPERILTVVAESAAEAPAELTRQAVLAALERWQPRVSSEAVLRSLRQAARVGARVLTPADPLWPSAVDDLASHAPIALWWRGNPEALSAFDSSVALVGARAATGYGEHVAMEASAGLVDRGFAIVSGAAYGIDGMAHRAALASSGTTMAFLAGGVDRFYPAGHDALLGRIVQAGVVLSELPCGAAPTRWRFLQRNRLIAASTRATIVLEAGWRSGSLNTAGHAAALARPLGAVPGPVTSATAAGCHRLIRDYAAICVTNAAEMAELVGEIGPVADSRDEAAAEGADRPPEQTRVLDAMSTRSPRSLGDLAARAGLAVATVQSVIGLLDLDGVVRQRETGWVAVPRR